MADALDSAVWSHLPSALLHLVLLRLPLETLLKFRTVCKHWRTLPLSPKVSTSTPNPRSTHPYLLGVNNIGELQMCPVYNPLTQQWRSLDLGFLQARFERFAPERWQSFEEDRFGSSELKSVSAHNGLLAVLARVHESEQDAIFVCNPLTKACNLLPLVDENSRETCLEVAIRAEDSGGYRVFVAKESRLQVYESVSSLWKAIPRCERFSHDAVSGVFCGEVYYALYEDVVMAWDGEAWTEAGVAVREQPGERKLVEVDGRLLCVAAVRGEGEGFVSVVEVDVGGGVVVGAGGGGRVAVDVEGGRWDAVGFGRAVVLVGWGGVFVLDLGADVPECRPLDLGAWRLPKLLVSFMFDPRASVD